MKKIALLLSVAILATSCNGQEANKAIAQDDKNSKEHIPKGSWTVNKELDENGNIIRYDSIYSWSSSSNDLRELEQVDADSIIMQMRKRMQSSFGMMGGDPFAGFFSNDSTQQDPFSNDPFLSDFFGDSQMGAFPNMESIRERMEQMMQRQLVPFEHKPLIPAVPEEKRKNKKTALKEKSI